MTTVTGTLKRGNGVALGSTPLRFDRATAAGSADGSIFGADVVTATTGTDGTFSVSLAGGAWVVTWPRGVGGHPVSRLTIGVPDDGGTVTLASLVDSAYVRTADGAPRFANIAAMLAADARTWSECRTLNSYGTDGVVSGWDRVLADTVEGETLSDNGDTVRETDDGRAFAVRTWVAL